MQQQTPPDSFLRRRIGRGRATAGPLPPLLRFTTRGWGGAFLAASAALSLLLFLLPHIRPTSVLGGSHIQLGVSKRVESISFRLLDPSSPERQLKDQVYLGKAYLAQAQLDGNSEFSSTLDHWVQESEAFLSTSLHLRHKLRTEPEFMAAARPFIANMSVLLLQARELHYDSAETIRKLREKLGAIDRKLANTNEELAAVSQVAAESVPRSILCLSVYLGSQAKDPETTTGPLVLQESTPGASTNPEFLHFCIFSDNLLALAVVLNSTVSSSLTPERLVFHIITDAVAFPSIRVWFALHPPKGATIEIQRLEDITWLNPSNVPVLRQMQDKSLRDFYFSADAGAATEGQRSPNDPVKFHNPKYMSLLNHGRFYLPQLFPSLRRVVLLDDDVVVQKDLTGLFTLHLQGSVNGAVETCLGQFHRFRAYLNFSDSRIASRFDPEGCGWAFGMNVFDLEMWKQKNVTSIYHFWQEQNTDHALWKLGTLPVGLLTYYGLLRPIDRSWHHLGLGYNKRLNITAFQEAAVLHWNGNLKPWLKIAIPKYRHYWTRFLDLTDKDLWKCGFA